MKKLTSIIILFSCLGFCFKTTGQVFQNSELTITKLEDNMWVIETNDKTTMYLVEGTQKAMLIDTGTKIEKLDSIISLITKKPLVVVITHAHSDHAGNIKFFKEIWMHPTDTFVSHHSLKPNGRTV